MPRTGAEYSCDLRPGFARKLSSASHTRFFNVPLAVSFSDGAIQCIVKNGLTCTCVSLWPCHDFNRIQSRREASYRVPAFPKLKCVAADRAGRALVHGVERITAAIGALGLAVYI